MGGSKVSLTPEFFLSAIRYDFSATSQRPIFAKFGHDTWIAVETQISGINLRKLSIQGFQGSFAPKPQTWRGSNRHPTQSRLQVKWCTEERYCLLHVVVQVSEVRSTFLYDVQVRSYGASKLSNFRILAYFPHTKRLKSNFRWPAYNPQVTSQNDLDFSMW